MLLERLADEEKTVGGIIIPDNAREKPSRGRVVAIGDGKFDDGVRVPMSVKSGDIVMFAKWASSASEIKIDGNEYIIIKETDILGILQGE